MTLDNLRFSRRLLRQIEDELDRLAARAAERTTMDRLRYLKGEVFTIRSMIENDLHIATGAKPGQVNGGEH